MKLNATPKHYMLLSQSQSDEDESGPSKEKNGNVPVFKNLFHASDCISIRKGSAAKEEIDPKKLPMSPLRLTLFIMSLILCVVFVITFVYGVPCTIRQNSTLGFRVTQKWKTVFPNMHFLSPLSTLHHPTLSRTLSILGYRSNVSGLVAIQDSSGIEVWRLQLHAAPSSTLCNEVDVNSDGIEDCLVLGGNGLLTAIDMKNGNSFWYIHNHSNISNANSIRGPILIPDCDNDNIQDVVISYNFDHEEGSSHLALVSGGTGNMIGSLIVLSQCVGPITFTQSWKMQMGVDIVLFCAGKESDNLWLLSSKDICAAASNGSNPLPMIDVFRIPYFVQDIQFYEVETPQKYLVLILDGYKILLLERTSQKQLKRVWKTHVGDQHARILTHGHFVENGQQLVIISTSGYGSKVFGLNMRNGSELWSLLLTENETVTYAANLRGFFRDTDGLLLKLVSSATFYKTDNFNEEIKNTSSDHSREQSTTTHSEESNLQYFQENYIVVRCGKTPIIHSVSGEKIIARCKGIHCHPDVYTTNATVLVKQAVTVEDAFDVLTVTSTLDSAHRSAEEMIVKRLSLKNISQQPHCHG